MPDQNDHAEPPPVPSTNMDLFTTKQEKNDSLDHISDIQLGTSSPCYVNTALADDEEKCLPEKYLQLKASVERYTSVQRNVVALLHIMLPDLNIKKVSSIDNFFIQLINMNTNQPAWSW